MFFERVGCRVETGAHPRRVYGIEEARGLSSSQKGTTGKELPSRNKRGDGSRQAPAVRPAPHCPSLYRYANLVVLVL